MLADNERIVIDGIIFNGTSATAATAHSQADSAGENTVTLRITNSGSLLIVYPDRKTDLAKSWTEAAQKMKENFFDRKDDDIQSRTDHRTEYDQFPQNPNGRGKLLSSTIIADLHGDGHFTVKSTADTADENVLTVKPENGNLVLYHQSGGFNSLPTWTQIREAVEPRFRQTDKARENIAALKASFKN